jgi:hypothetical protein
MGYSMGHRPPHTGKGKGITFLREHMADEDGECLIWPLSRHPTGYGTFGYEGKQPYAHRFMCELVNGPAPSPEHEAAHSCSRGHEGCVHPKHLSWKTRSGNQRDRYRNGAKRGWKGRRKITEEQAGEILRLKDVETVTALAKRFGVSRANIYQIHQGLTWKPDKPVEYTADEVAYLARAVNEKIPRRIIAQKLGRSMTSVDGKIHRMRQSGLVAPASAIPYQ